MNSGLPNRPRILRGAFVELGVSRPPLSVVFQFNPVQLTRNRSLSFAFPGAAAPAAGTAAPARTMRQIHNGYSDLRALWRDQLVTVNEQTISFDLRLDASDKLNDGDPIVTRYGVAPQIATLELMVTPKNESEPGGDVESRLGKSKGFSFARTPNPPLILFIFGRNRVLPVNVNAMNITETEFSAELNPVQATVGVNLTVIEGNNLPYRYSALNLKGAAELTNVAIPG